MKEMLYSLKRKDREILESGVIKGHYFAIISYGTHPCAYVSTKLTEDEAKNTICCHGDVTFFDTFEYWSNGKEICDKLGCEYNQQFLGWDYNHCWDYNPSLCFDPVLTDIKHKWTTSEIFDEVVGVIEQIIEMEGNE